MTDELARVVAEEQQRRARESALAMQRATVTEIRIARIIGNGSADADGCCKHCGLEMSADGEGNWLHLPPECSGPPVTCVCGAPVKFEGGTRVMLDRDSGTKHDCSAWKRNHGHAAGSALPYLLRHPRPVRRTYDDE